jgi:hypothetical protein
LWAEPTEAGFSQTPTNTNLLTDLVLCNKIGQKFYDKLEHTLQYIDFQLLASPTIFQGRYGQLYPASGGLVVSPA